MIRSLQALFVLLIFVSGCTIFRSTAGPSDLDYPAPDSDILALLDSYRPLLEREMGEQIAVVMDTVRFRQPEGALGNMVADALRFRASLELGRYIHLGIIGESSFQTYFLPGPLTVGDLYEFMPYENHLVVLELSGSSVQQLMHQVAELSGAPVSGPRFSIDDQNRARGVIINSEVIDLSRTYLVATSSWIANGGDPFSALWSPLSRMDFEHIDIRELYIDFFRGRAEIYNETDGRIRK